MDTDISMEGLFEEDSSNNSLNSNNRPNNALHVNPWVVKCHHDHLINLAATIEEKNTPQNFLLLENLTNKFRLPCILDLKMGTRQYDDCDTLAKRQSKMVKVVTTTSGKLGVRIGGMQVYQVTTGRFLCRNKFFGRSLTTNGFSNALRHFLHDGQRLRTELLPSLIRKLEILADKLATLESLRLYTTSLLLLYEGQPLGQPPPIDRLREKRESLSRNVTTSFDCDLWDCCESGMERSTSAESLTDILETVVGTNEIRRTSRDLCRRRSSSCTAPERLSSPTNTASDSRSNSPSSPLDPLTDVRIIDFAHSTHAGMSDSVSYTGPDHGFLFGLGNMISILKAIDRELR
uniref:Kinase n=1 Tax=Triatoma infestans TaxID=30076 RepID=A0A023F8E0_TRIIF